MPITMRASGGEGGEADAQAEREREQPLSESTRPIAERAWKQEEADRTCRDQQGQRFAHHFARLW